mmetsp:Transcript_2849/g.8610  ORF Transcript_2849/g.8610 Transcript_2849/m.8610 type:complete len:237 (+) Transcript_2849:102-812(+)
MAPVAAVVGASRGIGLGLARALRDAGWKVYATCRGPCAALEDLAAPREGPGSLHVVEGVDVGQRQARARLEAALAAEDKIDLLVFNAGLIPETSSKSVLDVDLDQCEEMFRVNALGPVLAVQALMDKLHEGAKLFLVTSRSASLADNGSGKYFEYRASKVAMNMLGVNLALELKPKGVSVCLVHPGLVITRKGMEAMPHAISVDTSVAGILARVDEWSLDRTGEFVHAVTGETLPW